MAHTLAPVSLWNIEPVSWTNTHSCRENPTFKKVLLAAKEIFSNLATQFCNILKHIGNWVILQRAGETVTNLHPDPNAPVIEDLLPPIVSSEQAPHISSAASEIPPVAGPDPEPIAIDEPILNDAPSEETVIIATTFDDGKTSLSQAQNLAIEIEEFMDSEKGVIEDFSDLEVIIEIPSSETAKPSSSESALKKIDLSVSRARTSWASTALWGLAAVGIGFGTAYLFQYKVSNP